ncbi:MAG: TetR family transcriptional regulator C-terminal domain-containing protein [Nocardioides sp.]
MARMTAAERREAIVAATLAVILDKGLAATTVRDVAERMGTSSGLIHHYFPSMDDVLAQAFDVAATADLETTRRAVGAGHTPTDQLRLFFASYTRADQDWSFQLWLDAWAEAGRRPAVQATSRRVNIAWQELLDDIISRGVHTGEFACARPGDAAWRILSLLDGLALQSVAHRNLIDRESVIAWSMSLAERELGLTEKLGPTDHAPIDAPPPSLRP